MIVLGIDPGKTIGLCFYDSTSKRVTGAFEAHSVCEAVQIWKDIPVDAIAIERPRIYSKGGAEIADTLEQFGSIWVALMGSRPKLPAESIPVSPGAYRIEHPTALGHWAWALERRAVLSELSAQLGSIVKGDSGVWAAMVDLHGGKGIADKRYTKSSIGGPLDELRGFSHAKAALAVAYVAAALEAKCAR